MTIVLICLNKCYEHRISLSIAASIIGGVIWGVYKWVKQKPLTDLMNELADKNTSIKRQKKILSIIDKRLMLSNHKITSSYIRNFYANGRSKLAIFYDICNENNIEPTTEICKLLIGSDECKFRNEWVAKRIKTNSQENCSQTNASPPPSLPKSSTKISRGSQVIF